MLKRIGILFIVVLALTPSVALADWTTYGGTPQRTRMTPRTDLNGHLKQAWNVQMPGVLEYPPSVNGDVFYTAQDDGFLSARSVTDGHVIWQNRPALRIAQTPTYHNKRLYFASENRDGTDFLYSVNATTGSVVWKQPGISTESATTLIMHGIDGNLLKVPRICVADRASNIQCFTLGGKLLWRQHLKGQFASAMAYAKGRLYAANYSGDVYCLKPNQTGRLAWHRYYRDMSLLASVSYHDGHLIMVSRGATVSSLDATTGLRKWMTYVSGTAYGSPAVAGGYIYTSSEGYNSTDGRFLQIKESNGQVTWSYHPGTRAITSPVVIGDRAFFQSNGGAAGKGKTYGFRIGDGTMKLVYTFPDGRYTPMVPTHDGVLLIGFGWIYRLLPV